MCTLPGCSVLRATAALTEARRVAITIGILYVPGSRTSERRSRSATSYTGRTMYHGDDGLGQCTSGTEKAARSGSSQCAKSLAAREGELDIIEAWPVFTLDRAVAERARKQRG